MPYPTNLTPLSGTRINTTPQVDTHTADHNTISAALTDIINELGANPSGSSADLTAYLAVLNPVGVVQMWGGAGAAPAGWHLCDGTAISRITYPSLFAILGTAYGVGDGDGTTFNLPDMRNRFPAGLGPATWSDTRSDFGGSKDSTMIDHQHAITAHTHPVTVSGSGSTATDGLHAHVETYQGGSQGWLYRSAYNSSEFDIAFVNNMSMSGYGYSQPSTGTGGSLHAHAFSLTSNGSASGNPGINTTGNTAATGVATDTNLVPYRVFNFIIRLT